MKVGSLTSVLVIVYVILSRAFLFQVKFNPEKIDTMIVQAVSLLDDIDKELNNYIMRFRFF